MVPEDLPCGILHLFMWVRNETQHACVLSFLYVIVMELAFGCAVVGAHLMTYLFF